MFIPNEINFSRLNRVEEEYQRNSDAFRVAAPLSQKRLLIAATKHGGKCKALEPLQPDQNRCVTADRSKHLFALLELLAEGKMADEY